MAPTSGEPLSRNSQNQHLTSPSSLVHDVHTTPTPHHNSYFDANNSQHTPNDGIPENTIAPIPEGTTLRAGKLGSTSKPPSPAHSSDPTTGTTTTPTSLENTSPSNVDGNGPEFPRHGLSPSNRSSHTSHAHPHQSHTSQSSHPQHHPPPFHPEDVPGWSLAPHPDSNMFHNADYRRTNANQSQSSPQQTSDARYSSSNYAAAFKLLVSNNVAGSIIGRAGQTISELQKESSTRIKLSQTGDYYPGTQDRVCLIQGDPEHCKVALRLLLERLHMLQEHQHSQHMAWQLQRQKGAAPSFDFVVRLLVPMSSCGMIIGKSGSNIKFMEESTGVSSVRLSPKDSGDGGYSMPGMMPNTSERIVTVTGPNVESCLKCVCLILDGMVAHPDICRYSNMTTSYSRLVPDGYAPANRPVLLSVPQVPNRIHQPEPAPWDMMPGTNIFPQSSEVPRRIASSPDLPGIMLNQRLPGVVGDTPSNERVTGGYGMPQHSFSPLPGLSNPGGGLHQVYLLPQQQRPVDSMGADGHAVGHSVSAPDLLALQLEQSMQFSSPAPPPQPSPPSQEYGEAFVSQPPTLIAPGLYNAQILVPDSMIGSILGRGGSTLTELESLSGTRIRASQRGDFAPGTRSRIVTIKGPTAQSVWQAQFMMSQRMVLPPTAVYSSQQHHINGIVDPYMEPQHNADSSLHPSQGTANSTATS